MKVFKIFVCGIILIVLSGCGERKDMLEGTWSATVENQNQTIIDNDGNTQGRNEDYYLECNESGSFTLKTKKETIVMGYYEISDDKQISFTDESNGLLAVCELVDKKELDCSEHSTYAFKYTKID